MQKHEVADSHYPDSPAGAEEFTLHLMVHYFEERMLPRFEPTMTHRRGDYRVSVGCGPHYVAFVVNPVAQTWCYAREYR